jgi:hypothetical protein
LDILTACSHGNGNFFYKFFAPFTNRCIKFGTFGRAVRKAPPSFRGSPFTLFACGASDSPKMACYAAPTTRCAGAAPHGIVRGAGFASAASQKSPTGDFLATARRPTVPAPDFVGTRKIRDVCRGPATAHPPVCASSRTQAAPLGPPSPCLADHTLRSFVYFRASLESILGCSRSILELH